MTVTATQRAESALRFLKQKTERFESFHAANFQLIVREFVEFLERDDVLGFFVRALKGHITLTGPSWYQDTIQRGSPAPMPQDPVACFAFRYDVIRLVRLEKLDLRYLASSFYPGAHLNEKLMHWKREVIHPFGEDCRRFADRAIAALPAADNNGYIDALALFQEQLGLFGPEAFGPRAWGDKDDEEAEARAKKPAIDAGAPKPAPAPAAAAEPTDLGSALDALERAVLGAELDDGARADLGADVRALRLEASRARPRPERALARLDEIGARAPLAAAVDRVRKLWPRG
jgi:hypothetical protein